MDAGPAPEPSPGPVPKPAPGPGFRRRVLIEPGDGAVSAELEDDWHRMRVTLHHRDGVVRQVEAGMRRSPWTACPGAIEQLRATFEGVPLAGVAKRGERTSNCTHLHDLALFAAAHAADDVACAYEIAVTDPDDGRVEATLCRDGALLLHWTLEGDRLSAPPELAGQRLAELGAWIAAQDPAGREAGRLLRWATIMAGGRFLEIPADSSATRFAGGACFTFQPERAATATRRPDADRDFSRLPAGPMADRADVFPPS